MTIENYFLLRAIIDYGLPTLAWAIIIGIVLWLAFKDLRRK